MKTKALTKFEHEYIAKNLAAIEKHLRAIRGTLCDSYCKTNPIMQLANKDLTSLETLKSKLDDEYCTQFDTNTTPYYNTGLVTFTAAELMAAPSGLLIKCDELDKELKGE